MLYSLRKGCARLLKTRRVAVEHSTNVPINLNLTVRNFGPVAHGAVTLKPLTIFIGPNNSGKSYIATLLRSIMTAQRNVNFSHLGSRSVCDDACHDLIRQKYDKDKYKIAITKPETRAILRSLVDKNFRPALEEQIMRDFGSGVRELVRTGKNSASIEVSEQDPVSSETRKLSIKLDGSLSIKAAVKTTGYLIEALPGSRYYYISTLNSSSNQNSTNKSGEKERLAELVAPDSIRARSSTYPRRLFPAFAVDVTKRILDQFQFRTVPKTVYYFPAARSSILQIHKAFTASIVAHAQYGGIERIEIPQVTGVVGDLLSGLILLRQEEGPFSSVANAMEHELLGGNIRLGASAKNVYPEITYQYNGSRIPLHRTSSTVSEIAPLSLYLKHVIGKNSLLIIEEPEAHLHPANELVLAKYLVRLIRSGVNILMTTHSVFLLEKLALYTMAGGLSPARRPLDRGYDEKNFLSPDEVSAYLFEKCPGGGHVIKPVERDEECGISQEEFIKVNEVLLQDTIAITTRTEGAGND